MTPENLAAVSSWAARLLVSKSRAVCSSVITQHLPFGTLAWMYRVAAILVLALHLGFILWVIFGALFTRGKPVLCKRFSAGVVIPPALNRPLKVVGWAPLPISEDTTRHRPLHRFQRLHVPVRPYHEPTTPHITPFAHALFGASHLYDGAFPNTPSQTPFTFAFGGGIDVPVRGWFVIRAVQLDWIRANFPYSANNILRVLTRLVFRLGSSSR
jgi:hypothetical protein